MRILMSAVCAAVGLGVLASGCARPSRIAPGTSDTVRFAGCYRVTIGDWARTGAGTGLIPPSAFRLDTTRVATLAHPACAVTITVTGLIGGVGVFGLALSQNKLVRFATQSYISLFIGTPLIVFAECGLLIGFFLPGDSLLFTAGLFVANGSIDAPLWAVCLLLVTAAFVGNVCGYYIGRAAGPAVFDKPKSRLFKPQHVTRTQEFFDRYGNRAIVLGRFVPIVRTFITVMAGVGQMIRAELGRLGFEVRWVDMRETGRAGHIVATHRGRGRNILLIGHLDTVFEPDSPFQRLSRTGNRATGPGIGDDKGGLVVIVAALRAMHETGTLRGANITIAGRTFTVSQAGK